ncbi:MAG TPA: Tn3 family transposase, partial [Gammaproteobacteria bacterium]|nr:Tn3 family transposase [Gammaproteobacteria bacterium]
HYLPNDNTPKQLPTRKIQRKTKEKILQLMGFDDNLDKTDQLILEKASEIVKTTQNPLDIFESILKQLESAKRVLPKYSRLQDIIGMALKNEDQRLIKMVKHHLTKSVRGALQNLFQSDDAFYHITELKFDAKSFQTKEMTAEIKKLDLCRPIYDFTKDFLPKLSLSRHMVEHYSDLAKLYSVWRLQNIPPELSYLYLICYVHGRYERLTNNLIQAFVYYVDKYQNEAKDYAKHHWAILKNPLEQHQTAIGKLMGIFTDKAIMKLSGNKIEKHAFDIMPEERITTVSKRLLEGGKDRIFEERRLMWEYHKSNYQSLLINLRPLFMVIDFEGNPDLKDLFKAITFLKSSFQKKELLNKLPLNLIPIKHIKPKLLLDLFIKKVKAKKSGFKKVINPYQYEFHVYRTIRDHIKSSKIYINTSIGYKSFEAEIKMSPNWQKEKKRILKDLNNPILLRPIQETLAELEGILEPLIVRTNKRALNGDNKHIHITHHRDGRVDWTIPYPKRNKEADNPFYDQLDTKTISEIFDFVEQKCGFMKAFIHIKPKGAKSKKDYLGIKATILANGTMQGTHLFSKRSNLKYQRLQTAEQNHVRLATLQKAAEIIVNHMINLPIFDLYDLGGKKHGSIDGTKKKTRRRILRARHSKKYFGGDIGVVVMSMILGHVPFVSKIIGANEHESHYTYPMLHNNSTEIDPDIISTDTAGTNNVNDFMYYLIGKLHAPCYRSTAKKTKTLCGFKSLSHYKNLLIKPSRAVNRKRITQKWPELIPVLVSLLSHNTTQENILKILSSHEYKSDVKEAFWELNQILKSIHLLKDIDDPKYRRNIRTALNRGEAYHQLLGKIMSVGGGDFRGMSDLEVEIWNECARLLALIIIYYNMHLLSKLYEVALAKKDKAVLKFLKHISPVASQHINISGLYEFSEIISTINVDGVVAILSRILKDVVYHQK